MMQGVTMKRLLIITALVVGCMFMAIGYAAGDQEQNKDAVKRGQYVAHEAICVACHSFDKGPFSGGTPFGIAYSPNITPDLATGIGSYTFEDFDRVVRRGVSKKGFSLSVMMPPCYSGMTDADIRDLYAYFMKGVAPVNNAVKSTGKERAFTGERVLRPFAPEPGEDPVAARGRYLVESMGHCGFCHTSRNAKGEELAVWASHSNDFLAGGGAYAGWFGINLRGDNPDGLALRTVDDLTEFFLTGRNDRTASFGKMTDVIESGTQYLTPSDARAMATFLKTLPPKNPSSKPFKEDPSVAKRLWKGDDSMRGAAVYVDNCAACHKTNGAGYKRFFPELRGNPVVLGDNPVSLIHITLMGQTLPGFNRLAPSPITMPPFAWRLDDQQVADVVSFIRASWGNKAPAVSAQDVQKLRTDKHVFPNPKVFGDSDVDKLLNEQL
jgi:mono/diheme cytochrome c family protein